jgi:hypothetical protein
MILREPVGKPIRNDGGKYFKADERYWLEIYPFFARSDLLKCVEMMKEHFTKLKEEEEEEMIRNLAYLERRRRI